MDKINELYIYETVDWEVGACVDEPPGEVVVLTTRNFTASQIKEILNDWNMSIPHSIINSLKAKYL